MKGALLAAVVVVVSVVLASAARAAPYQPPRDAAFEQKIQAEIQARDPEGAALFAQATSARDRGDDAAYADLLEKVHARDPWFSHATRRLCQVESQREHHERALALCREAYAAEASPENASGLATALLAADNGGNADYGTRALELAREAAQKAPNEFFTQFTLCQASLRMKDTHTFSTAAAAMRRIAPRDAFTLFFSALDDGMKGQLDDGLRELDEAHAAGLPDATYEHFHEVLDDARSPVDRWGPRLLKGFVAWLAIFALLLGLGAVLSGATLRAASRVPTDASGRATGGDA